MVYYFYYNIIIPIFVIIFVFFIILAICLTIKNRRRDIPPNIHSRVSVVRVNDIENIPSTNRENVHKEINKCMLCSNNLTYWRLNCGGTLCNTCIINFSTALASNEALQCPECHNAIFNFSFMNRYATNSDREHFDIVEAVNIDQNSPNMCNICCERICDKRINCHSSDHYLCYLCYDRLINVQRILLCPYCRTLIKNTLSDEQAPVVLGS